MIQCKSAAYQGERTFDAWALGGQVLVGIRVPLGTPRVFLGLNLGGELLGRRLAGTLAPLWSVGTNVEGGVRF